jgi:hypothetical protein
MRKCNKSNPKLNHENSNTVVVSYQRLTTDSCNELSTETTRQKTKIAEEVERKVGVINDVMTVPSFSTLHKSKSISGNDPGAECPEGTNAYTLHSKTCNTTVHVGTVSEVLTTFVPTRVVHRRVYLSKTR